MPQMYRFRSTYIHNLYSLLTCMLITIQTTTSDLRSQNTTLQAALEGAREEIAARKEHEVELTSQLQVCLRC